MSITLSPKLKKIKLSDNNTDLASNSMDSLDSKLVIQSSADNNKLDQKALNKFSRQNAALGVETTAKLIKMKVVIVGLRGIGIETAKNLSLQGVGAITLIDQSSTDIKDVGVNFFLHKSDVGKIRSHVIAPKLRDLNPICAVSTSPILDEQTIMAHSAVVITQILPLDELMKINEFCRKNRISFFFAYTGGVSVDIFVDHGSEHIVTDFNGEKPIQKLITDVLLLESSNECLIRYETPEGQQPVSLSNGSYEISEVNGIYGINNSVYPITHPDKDPVKTIRIPFKSNQDLENKYLSGGIITEKKLPTKYPMESLEYKLKNPGNTFAEPPTLVLTDLINFGSELQQHVSLIAVMKFAADNGGRLPTPNDENEAEIVLKYAKDIVANKEVDIDSFEVDDSFVKRFAIHSGVELQPLSAFAGGVLAQEVVKSTGKFTPIPGFFHFSAPEALPTDKPDLTDLKPRGLENDELAAIYGWSFIEKLNNLKYFMVGCGALGCEFMKNFALNGICCGPNGKLVVTDADRIELSNLTRQFLFREHNVGQPKSKAAANMAKVMNANFNVEALELFVGPKTENVFNDNFWTSLDGVCNALDNMEARIYVDIQCVKYEKSLLESGTMGTSGNVDTICPFKTRTYRDGGNAAEGGGVPMCTLRNFPHLTDHCIEWARDQFELLFTKLGKSCESYFSDPELFETKIKEKAASEPGAAFFDIRSVISLSKLVTNPSIGGAAQLAFDLFHFLFRDKILDLQHAFPQDSRIVDKDTGADKGPFWGEKKRYPTVVMFNPQDESHTNFILSATCLFAVMVKLIQPKREDDDKWLEEYRSMDFITNIISGLKVPPYIQAPINADGITEEAKAKSLDKSELDNILNSLFSDLRTITQSYNRGGSPDFEVADFEKDDDLNFHISFITSAANLRCDNYSIKRTDFQSCKVIAGKIIAAIATTTAAVCGLVILELFKLLLKKDTEAYMNRAIGLAQYTYTSFTQEPPYKFKTFVEVKPPSANDELPADAYDASGKLKEEFITKEIKRAYPENHSVWDKITVPGNLTLKEFIEWLKSEHNLKLLSWDYIYGYKTVVDESSKEKRQQGVSAPIYPPKLKLDYSLLPSLELTMQQATMAIMKTASAKPTQQYIALWRECKEKGFIPTPSADEFSITESTTLIQILQHMSDIAEKAEKEKIIETKAISDVKDKQFVVIPSSEVPLCQFFAPPFPTSTDPKTQKEMENIDDQGDIEYLCSLKILLK